MKQNRSRFILLFTCFCVLLIPACTAKTSPVESPQSAGNSGGAGPTGNGAESIGLGSIGYTVDESRSESDIFEPGTGLPLAVTDANGFRWSLYIPPEALWESQTITMTPFATIDTSKSDAKIASGVKLEPDGLQFNLAIHLTVTPPDTSSKAGLVFSFHQDGSGVNFAPTAGSRGDSIGFLWHFSAAGYTNEKILSPEQLETLTNKVNEVYKETLDSAKKFVNDGNPPTPAGAPQISMFCRGTEKNPEEGEAYEWMMGFLEPYNELVEPLLTANKLIGRLGLQDLSNEEVNDTAKKILNKAEAELKKLGDQYQQDKPPDRLTAVIYTALHLNGEISFLAGESILFPGVVASWASTLRDYYFNELVTNHDFRAFPIVLKLNHEAGILGGPDRFEEIISAMTFEVDIDTEFSGKWVSDNKTRATGEIVQK